MRVIEIGLPDRIEGSAEHGDLAVVRMQTTMLDERFLVGLVHAVYANGGVAAVRVWANARGLAYDQQTHVGKAGKVAASGLPEPEAIAKRLTKRYTSFDDARRAIMGLAEPVSQEAAE